MINAVYIFMAVVSVFFAMFSLVNLETQDGLRALLVTMWFGLTILSFWFFIRRNNTSRPSSDERLEQYRRQISRGNSKPRRPRR